MRREGRGHAERFWHTPSSGRLPAQVAAKGGNAWLSLGFFTKESLTGRVIGSKQRLP
jgi:hypothetical protein